MVNPYPAALAVPRLRLFPGALLCCLLMLALLPAAFAQQQGGEAQGPDGDAPLQAYVDRNSLSENEVLTLTVRVDSDFSNERPVVSGLDRDFIQLSTQAQNTYSNFNGNVQSWTEYRVSLTPRAPGTLTIPSFRLNNERTDPITITVTEEAADGSETQEIFLESSISKNELYVQEQLVYTLQLHYAVSFDQGAQLTTPQVEDAVVQQLGNDRTFQEIIDGVRYNVTERTFVIFPQSSGLMHITPVFFTATVGGRGNFNRLRNRSSREVRLSTEDYDLLVMPQPASFPGSTWLPAENISVTESWSGDPADMRVGESITRNIEIAAQGLSSSLLPAIEYNDIPGLKFYPDKAETDDTADSGGVRGSRSESIAVVPSEPGDYLLPEIRLPWWNTETDSLEYAVIPATTLQVSAPPGVFQGEAPQQPQPIPETAAPDETAPGGGNATLWIAAAGAFALAWLFTTFLWLRKGRAATAAMPVPAMRGRTLPERSAPGADAALKRLEQACRANDLRAMRLAVIEWGRAWVGNDNIRTLDDLRAYCGNPTLSALLFNLEQALYGNGQDQAGEEEDGFRSSQLYKEVKELHKHGRPRREDGDSRYGLPPLYKN